MASLYTIETLQPELQIAIMRYVTSTKSLLALLNASPRFYQVFRTRKEYVLTELARNQFPGSVFVNAWDTAKALQLPQPLTREVSDGFIETFAKDNQYEQPVLPLSISISICQLGPLVNWFVQDFWSNCLGNLKRLGACLGLQQDVQALESPLSAIEKGRIQRAFCRFETTGLLLTTLEGKGDVYLDQGQQFLGQFTTDDIEEVACVRDYFARRLWGVFEAIEEDAMRAKPSDAIRRLGREFGEHDWFSRMPKHFQPDYMENIMILGLPFLREVLESRGLQRAGLVIATSKQTRRHFTQAFESGHNEVDPYHLPPFDSGIYCGEQEFHGDSLQDCSHGWLYANRGKLAKDYNRWTRKGFRDWGYVMLDSQRLKAAGVLERDPEELSHYFFDDGTYVDDQPCVTSRLEKN
ncbi:MAG: hypothetical protein LQ345_005714, partial [Seirophora villosa]